MLETSLRANLRDVNSDQRTVPANPHRRRLLCVLLRMRATALVTRSPAGLADTPLG